MAYKHIYLSCIYVKWTIIKTHIPELEIV